MILNSKVTAFLIAIPFLLALQGQSSSCRQGSPPGAATAAANRLSETSSGGNAQANANKSDGTVVASSPKNKNMNDSSNQKTNTISAGTWGGPHIRVRVGTDGAEIEYDCAHGTISAPLTLNAEGRFELRGTHRREGGPIRVDRKPQGRPARFVGQVEGKQMTLTVTLTDTSQEIGSFTLTHGSQGRLWKCY